MPSPTADPSPPDAAPAVSVVIVAYRSDDDLARCLPTLMSQRAPGGFEVIVVDNGPPEAQRATAAWLTEAWPEVRHLPNENSGYAGGNNRGFEAARGRYVFVLNPDTEVRPGALAALLEAAEANPGAFVNAKLVQPDGSVNASGNQMHYTGITTCRGLGEDPARYRGVEPVPLLSGGAFLAARADLLALGGFDEDYFMYLEDTDLSLRARLAGHPLLCANEAVVVHHYTLAMSPRKFEHLERNRLLTLLKVYQRRTLTRLLPALLLTELATWAFALLKGPRYLAARARGYRWLWRHRSSWGARRRAIQGARRVADDAFLRDAQAALPFDQLLGSPGAARLFDRLTRPVFTLLRPRFGDRPEAPSL